MPLYNVVLLDKDDYEITSSLVEGIAAAKKTALYLLSAEYAKAVESTHETLGAHKAEIRAEGDYELLWDRFL